MIAMTTQTSSTIAEASPATPPQPEKQRANAFSFSQLVAALPGAFRKLDPRLMWRNPVMFVVEVGALLTTAIAITLPLASEKDIAPTFTAGIAVWLWITVVFANLAESVAEGRGKAQAASLRQTRTSTVAHRVGFAADSVDRSHAEDVSSADLVLGDYVEVSAGEVIPGDGDIVWGIASVDESAITGCLLYTSPSPRDRQKSRMPSSA